jgi:hypothetical protein
MCSFSIFICQIYLNIFLATKLFYFILFDFFLHLLTYKYLNILR